MKNQIFKTNRIWWYLYLAFLVADGGINLIISFILQQLTDAAVDKSIEKLICVCIFCVIAVFGILVASVALYYTESILVKRVMMKYKETVFQGLLRKNRSDFLNENTSVYLSALTNDAAVIETDYLKGTAKLFAQVVSFVATIAVMLVYSPYLTVAALGFSVIPILFSLLAGDSLAMKEKEISVKNANFVGMMKDMLTGFPVIKSFRAETEVEKVYKKENAILEMTKYNRNLLVGKIGLFAQFGVLLSQFGIFITGAYLSIAGKGVTAGILIAFVNMMGSMMAPISVIPQLYGKRKAAWALIQKMESFLNENRREWTGDKLTAFQHQIVLKSVSFGYTEEKDMLTDISVEFEKGKSYAIVGSSGSGKSTLLDVLMGNFKEYRGSVTYDGKELRQLDNESLFDLISVIQQDVFIFDASIGDNITMFKEFSEDFVKQVITLSGLDRVIEEKGEDYLCGENGCNLSGGERQRISIARSLLRKTPILIMDEATAALDVKTAFDILDGVMDRKEITKIVVTHQLDKRILQRYDGIVVLRNGKIEEMGMFDKLMEHKGYFYSLFTLAEV